MPLTCTDEVLGNCRVGSWSASGVIGWCIGAASIGGAFAGFIASQTKGSPWHQPVFDLLAAIAAIAFLLLVMAGQSHSLPG
jgi:hypothetical protein